MPPTQTGSTSVFDSAASSGSQSVTVPSDAKFAIALFCGWNSTLQLSSCTINSVGFTIHQTTSGADTFLARARLQNPATGAQTFAWTLSATFSEGGHVKLFFLKDADGTAAHRDEDHVNGPGSSTTTESITLDSGTTDWVDGATGSYTPVTADPSPASSDQTDFITVTSFALYSFGAATENTPGASSTTVSGTGSFCAVIGGSVKAAATAAGMVIESSFAQHARSNPAFYNMKPARFKKRDSGLYVPQTI